MTNVLLPSGRTLWRGNDLKSALALAGAFAMAAVASVPLLLPSLPAEARGLPLPLPLFCAMLAAQMLVIYGLFAYLGLRLARASSVQYSPIWGPIWCGIPQANYSTHDPWRKVFTF